VRSKLMDDGMDLLDRKLENLES